jgi:hypothetical protein
MAGCGLNLFENEGSHGNEYENGGLLDILVFVLI